MLEIENRKYKLVDGHMHLEYGPLTEEYVLAFVSKAQKMQLDEIQILDHTHRFKEFEPAYEGLKIIDKQKSWLEDKTKKFKDSLNDYLNLIEKVKKLSLPLKVSFGLEVCYSKETEAFLKSVLENYHFDFLVGSVHSVDNRLIDMSFTKEILWDKYDANEVYRMYYDSVINCVNSGLFTQLAHPDSIKLYANKVDYNLKPTYELLADSLLKMNMKAENNVGCKYRYNHPDLGLNDELLKVFMDKKVEIITASDAHKPEDVGTLIKEATLKMLNRKREN